MKTIICSIVVSLAALASTSAFAGEPPAKKLWQMVIGTNTAFVTYDVRQIVADGSGGCSLIYTRTEMAVTTYHVIRLDKKGVQLWHAILGDLTDMDIVYADSKITVVCMARSSGDKFIMTFDTRNNQTTTSESGTDTYNNVNDTGEYGSPCDKKGFFAMRFNKTSFETVLNRHSYKPEK